MGKSGFSKRDINLCRSALYCCSFATELNFLAVSLNDYYCLVFFAS